LVMTCLLKHIIEGKIEERIEVTGRRGRRRKQLLDDRKDNRRYCKLINEGLDRTLSRTQFVRGCRPVVRQTKYMNEFVRVRLKVFRVQCKSKLGSPPKRSPEMTVHIWHKLHTKYIRHKITNKTSRFPMSLLGLRDTGSPLNCMH